MAKSDNSNKTLKEQREIEIADFIFANPGVKRKDIVAKFVKKWQTSPRTVDRFFKSAKDRVESLKEERERIKNEVRDEETKKLAKEDVLSHNEGMKILSSIARGNGMRVPIKQVVDGEGKVTVTESRILHPSHRERVAAIKWFFEINGWIPPKQIEASGKGGVPLIPTDTQYDVELDI